MNERTDAGVGGAVRASTVAGDPWIFLPAHDYTLSFPISRPCPTPRSKGVAREYLPVPEPANTPLTGNVEYILRNVCINHIFQVPVTFHLRGTPLPHASTRPLKGALTNGVKKKLKCTPPPPKKKKRKREHIPWPRVDPTGRAKMFIWRKVIPARMMSLPGWLG